MSTLKNVTVIAAKMGSGISKKSGSPKPYQFANVTYLKQAEDYINDDHNIQSSGFDTREVNMAFNKDIYLKFKNSCPFGQPVDLILDADPENPARNVVVDFQLVSK